MMTVEEESWLQGSEAEAEAEVVRVLEVEAEVEVEVEVEAGVEAAVFHYCILHGLDLQHQGQEPVSRMMQGVPILPASFQMPMQRRRRRTEA